MNTMDKSATQPKKDEQAVPIPEKKERGKTSEKVVKLESSGETIIILKGKGKHAMNAQRVAGGDETMYMPALMAELIRKDGGGRYVMEDFQEMDLDVYMEILGHFQDQNFPSGQKI